MNEPLQCRVINLDRSVERLAAVTENLSTIPIVWSRFPAFEPPENDFLSDVRYRKDRASAMLGRQLSRGEMGCFQSHLGVLEQFLSSSATHCLALEDDIQMSCEDFQKLCDIFDWLKTAAAPRWSCLNLAGVYHKRFRAIESFKTVSLRRAYQFPVLTSALLWSRAGAGDFIHMVSRDGIWGPVDYQLRSYLAKTGLGLSVSQPLFKLSTDTSTISGRYISESAKLLSKAYLKRKSTLYFWSTLNQIKGT